MFGPDISELIHRCTEVRSQHGAHLSMTETRTVPCEFARFAELIRQIHIGLLTSLDAGGLLHTRPIETLEVDAQDPALWFFTDRRSAKADELQWDMRVSLGYSEPSERIYVAVSGVATLLHDSQRARQLWKPEQLAFYPDGPEDERLAILKVQVRRAEYWIAPGRAAYRYAAATAAATGTPVSVLGENQKISARPSPSGS